MLAGLGVTELLLRLLGVSYPVYVWMDPVRGVQLPPTTPDWQEAWRVTEGVLARGIQVTPVRERNEEFLRQLGAKDLYYPERRLAAFGKREGIPVLNLAPAMAEQAEKRQVYFHAHHDSLGIGHWNEEGHLAAGELIAPWLAREFADRSATSPKPWPDRPIDRAADQA